VRSHGAGLRGKRDPEELKKGYAGNRAATKKFEDAAVIPQAGGGLLRRAEDGSASMLTAQRLGLNFRETWESNLTGGAPLLFAWQPG
jgi:hypothetical protein